MCPFRYLLALLHLHFVALFTLSLTMVMTTSAGVFALQSFDIRSFSSTGQTATDKTLISKSNLQCPFKGLSSSLSAFLSTHSVNHNLFGEDKFSTKKRNNHKMDNRASFVPIEESSFISPLSVPITINGKSDQRYGNLRKMRVYSSGLNKGQRLSPMLSATTLSNPDTDKNKAQDNIANTETQGNKKMDTKQQVNTSSSIMEGEELKEIISKGDVESSKKKLSNEKDEKAKKKKQQVVFSNKPLEVHVIGLSHHNADVSVREKLAIPEAEWNTASATLCSTGAIAEASVLSTCNRFEIYFSAHDSYAAFYEATKFLEQHSGLPQSVLRKNLFLLSGEDCIWHLFRVSGGLDSLVVGEGQILSQVKQCYSHSIEEEGSGGKVISRMLNIAVAAGKRVRSETGISKGAVSISSAAVEFSDYKAPDVLGKNLENTKIAIIGAGKMTRLLLIHMASSGIKNITLLNRSRERADALAEEFAEDIEIDVRLMDSLWDTVRSHDMIFTSTSASGCIITKDLLEGNGVCGSAQPDTKKMLVDISVPRNVEQECEDVHGIYSYNVDDLKQVVDKNTALRKKQVLEAQDLLLEELEKFRSWQNSLGAIPAIRSLQEKAEAMRLEEMKKANKKLQDLSDKELDAVERLTKGIVNKLLHGPMTHLRATENLDKSLNALKTLKAVFEL